MSSLRKRSRPCMTCICVGDNQGVNNVQNNSISDNCKNQKVQLSVGYVLQMAHQRLASRFKSSTKSKANNNELGFRLLVKDDIEIIREIYKQGNKDRIIPAFLMGILKSSNLFVTFILFCVQFAVTRSFITGVVIVLLYHGAVFSCYYTFFWNHISRSLNSDLANVSLSYKTHETCRRYSDLAENDSAIWVAVRGNNVVGFVSFSHVDADTIELKRMGVSKKYRRIGVGVSLCQFAIKFLRATKYRRMILETTEAHQPAVHLYKKFQFQLIQRHKKSLGLMSMFLERYELSITSFN